jgi:tRNA (guanine37-N1)-methyltransferase
LRIDFVTIFPSMFAPFTAEGVIARGIRQRLLDIRTWDLRDYTTDRHRSTDDEAYGGGPGMVMLAEPVLRCVDAIRASAGGSRAVFAARDDTPASPASEPCHPERVEGELCHPERVEGEPCHPERAERVEGSPASSAGDPSTPLRSGRDDTSIHIILTSPQGRRFTQSTARELAEKPHLVFLCGRYEGFDHRVHEALQPDEISIGDFVVSGGELPAMLMADAIGRMIPGVVGNSGSVEEDSFFNGLLDYPHYTRPEEVRGRRIPDVLLSGHHEKIRKWRKEQALQATLAKRPDLLEAAALDDEAREILRRLREF